MAWLAVNEDGSEIICKSNEALERLPYGIWSSFGYSDIIDIPKGSIRKLIDQDITWEDEPVELKEAAE